jgi:hypothetical protein
MTSSSLTSRRAPACRPSGRSNRRQIPGLLLDPAKHTGENHKSSDNGCNNRCVYGRHDIPPFDVILPLREQPSLDLDQ